MTRAAPRIRPTADPQLEALAAGIQAQASDPTRSVWVGASAGTGKTELLTRRVLRLLAHDAGLTPDKIVCLTFTRHGAAEMQARLAERLRAFVATPELAEAQLGMAVAPERWSEVQAAWAKAPVVVGTIHSLAQRWLATEDVGQGGVRRIIGGDTAVAWLMDLQKTLLAEAPARGLLPLVERLLDDLHDTTWDDLARTLQAQGPRLDRMLGTEGAGGLMARLHEALGLGPGTAWARQSLLPGAEVRDFLAKLAPRWAKAGDVLKAMTREAPERVREAAWQAFLLTDKGTPLKRLATKAELKAMGLDEADLAPLREAQERLATQLRLRQAWGAAELTQVLVGWSQVLRGAYASRKEMEGVWDYQDLLDQLEAALADPNGPLPARLERSVRHLLLDEGQDNSPQQDRIIRTLTRLLLAGESPEGQRRTVLAVGDVKQSIFRFQGAAAELFVGLREELERWAGAHFKTVQVVHSFRSAQAILGAVDEVFKAPELAHTVQGEVADWPQHVSVLAGVPGRVDVWQEGEIPAAEKPADVGPWAMPEARWRAQPVHALMPLARHLAAWLKTQVGRPLPEEVCGPELAGEVLRWDDVMIVGPRNDRLGMLAGVLQEQGIPVAEVAGLVAPVVGDMVAWLRAAVSREDRVSVATVLKSPHFAGLDDAALWKMAQAGWQVPEPWAGWLAEDQAAARALRPLELVWRVILRHKLPPGPLAGLLAWAADAPSVMHLIARAEQEPLPAGEGHGRGVRLLTPQRAKGLEARLVVLFDTGHDPVGVREALLWDEARRVVVKAPSQGVSTWADEVRAAEEARRRVDAARSLYVAMTRAREWLVVTPPMAIKTPKGCWWEMVTAGLGYVSDDDQTAVTLFAEQQAPN